MQDFPAPLGKFMFWGIYSSFEVVEDSKKELIWFNPGSGDIAFSVNLCQDPFHESQHLPGRMVVRKGLFLLAHLQRRGTSYGSSMGVSHLS